MSGAVRFLNVPGYGNSGPEHWQTLWEAAFAGFTRVRQEDWDHPDCARWVRCLDDAVELATPVVLVAHSLGCATIAHWARLQRAGSVLAAFLVAPADVERPDFPSDATGFTPLPRAPLPFPSLVVASDNDEYVSIERACQFADAWGSGIINVGSRGHLNSAAGIGQWEEGQALLTNLLAAHQIPPMCRRQSIPWGT